MFYVGDCKTRKKQGLVTDTTDAVVESVSYSFLYKTAVELNISGVDTKQHSIDSVDIADVIQGFIQIKKMAGYHSEFVYVNDVLKKCYSNGDTELYIPYGIRYIAADCFAGDYGDACKIKKLVLPVTVKEIAHHAFLGLNFLQEIEFNEGLQQLGALCFDYCKQITNITLPSTLRKMMVMGKFGANVTIIMKSKEMASSTWGRDALGRRVETIEIGLFDEIPTVVLPRDNNYEDCLICKVGSFYSNKAPKIEYLD